MSTTSRGPARLSRPHQALVAVCLLHAVTPYLLRGLHPGYGWDETVYISQIDPHTVAGYFSAPRARGLTFLTAPAALLTSSVSVMRAWLTVLSGVGLYAAFRPWAGLRRGWTVPVAALLWSGVWVDIYYGYMAMPNQWIAYCAVAACGWLLRARAEPEAWTPRIGLGVALLVAALIRPSDSVAIVVPLLAFVSIDRTSAPRARLGVAGVMVASVAVGWVEWVIEAFVRFGGLGARLDAASVENGGTGLHWELGAQFRALGGPLLCRNGCVASTPFTDQVWWLVLAVLVVVGLIGAVRLRAGIARMDLLCGAVAVVLALEYVVLIGYAAPRFLAPSYALLAIPVAEGVLWIVRSASARHWRVAVTAVLVAAFAVQEVGQARIVRAISASNDRDTSRSAQLARFLRAHGVSRPCALTGLAAGPTSFRLGCFGIDTIKWVPIAERLARSGRSTVVIIFNHRTAALPFYAGWPMVEFREPGYPVWRVWIDRATVSSSGGAS